MTQPVKVLFLAADPFESGWRLRFDEELRELQDAILRGRECYPLEVQPRLATRATEVQTLLLREAPQVLHFSGHGERGRGIVMDEGDALRTGEIVRLLTHFRDSTRLVVLNACKTLPVAEALSPLVDYVIGTGAPVGDEAAIAFSRAFYGALAFGKAVPDAFALASNQLAIERLRDTRAYRLLVRPGVVPAPLHAPAQAAATAATVPAPISPGRQTIRIGTARTAKTAFNSTAVDGAQGGEQDIGVRDLQSTEIIEFNA